MLPVHLSMHMLLVYLYAPAFHVENIARENQSIGVEDAEAEYQEEQQEFEVADQVEEQALESNFANSDLQQGKHRFILNPESLH